MSATLMQVKRVTETIKEFSGIGEKIRKAREGDRRSLSEICRQSGISRSYWYQIENGDLRSPVTEAMIRKIEKILNIDLEVSFDN